jgi:hypothetical protein
LTAFAELLAKDVPIDATSGPELQLLSPALVAHHLLHDGLALFGDVVLFAGSVRAVFAKFFRLALHLHGDELIDFFATSLANRHAAIASASAGKREEREKQIA